MKLLKILFVYLFMIFTCLLSCRKSSPPQHLHKFLPNKNSLSLAIHIKDYQTFKSTALNSKFIFPIKGGKYDFISLFKPLNINFKEVMIAIHKTNKKEKTYDITLISHYRKEMFPDPLNLFQLKVKSTKGINIIETSLGTKKVYGVITKGVFLVSTSKQSLKHILHRSKSKDNDPTLEKLYLNVNSRSTATLFINNKLENILFNSMFKNTFLKKNATDWIVLETNIVQNKITFSGIGTSRESKQNKDILHHIKPTKIHLFSIIPEDIDHLIFYSVNGAKFPNNAPKKIDSLKMKVLRDIDNLGIIFSKKHNAALIHSKDVESLSKLMGIKKKEKITTFKSNALFNKLRTVLGEFNFHYIYTIDDFIILSNTKNFISKIISYYKGELTFDKSETYKYLSDELLNTSNITQIKISKKKKQKKIFFFQVSNEDGHLFFNGAMMLIKVSESKKMIEVLRMSLDSDVSIPPQFMYNHRSKDKDIIVQDDNHWLYLMDYSGKIFWKKQLKEKIIPPIRQVDIYRNGRYQLAFTTPHSFMIIDRDGNFVTPFKMNFKTTITQPLAVFDYNQDKNYRFVITTAKEVKMYNNRARIVKGFLFKKQSDFIHAPKHFQIKNKDYIVMMERSGKIKILNRKGQRRVNVRNSINFSNNDIFLYKNTFTTIDDLDRLVQVHENGRVTRSKLPTKDNLFYATSKTLAIVSGEKIRIKSNNIELELGTYSTPTIFYINDIIYVSVASLDRKKLYLFYSDGTLVKGFPVYGRGLIDLSDIDNDMMLEIVTQTDDDTIVVYKINSSR